MTSEGMARTAWVLAAAALLVASPMRARANMAATQRYPAQIGAPGFAAQTPLVVEEEKLRLDCAAQGEGISCRFEADYLVFNPTSEEARVLGAFYGVRTHETSIAADGVVVDHALTTEEIQRLDLAVRQATEKSRQAQQPCIFSSGWERFGLDLTVAAGARVRLVARGRMDPGERWIPRGYQAPAVEARHLLLGREPHERLFDLDYFVAPLWTWRGEPTIEVEVHYPDAFEFPVSEGWTFERTKEGKVARRTIATRSENGSLWLGFLKPAPLVADGGLLAGVGGAFGDQAGLRLRLGYEVALRGWLLASLAAESDLQTRVRIVPAIEAASPAILFIIPSVGVGAGVPVQVWPQARVGIRLQASLHVYPAGLLFAADFYPRAGSSRFVAEFSLLFQVGL